MSNPIKTLAPSSGKNKKIIYLASQSIRRIAFLRQMRLPFEIVPSRYIEKISPSMPPEKLVLSHALGKVKQSELPKKLIAKSLVLGADTIVHFNGKNLGKPQSYQEAEKQLFAMSGRTHYVYTAIALLEPKTGRSLTGFMRTKVKFRRWGKKKIASYVRKIKALDKAGGYAIQSTPCIVDSYEGSLSNVIGLPKELLAHMLEELNF